MKIALDTNRYSDLGRGDPDALRVVGGATEVSLPVIVLGELRSGFLQGSRPVENEAALQRFLSRPGVSVLSVDDQTTHIYAALEADLRKRGRAIPTNDIWIAAISLQHGLALYSRDPHFDNIPNLQRV